MALRTRHGRILAVLCTALLLSSTGVLHPQAVDANDLRFGNPRPALQRFIAGVEPKARGPQHFCVVTYPDNEGYAWVHWREGNRLILWLGAAADPRLDDTLVFSTRKLDLATDVVARDEEIRGSTYLVTRAWVAERLADCQKRGARYVLSGS